eukprot:1232144-Alexandrium_andersonii.AAC.1
MSASLVGSEMCIRDSIGRIGASTWTASEPLRAGCRSRVPLDRRLRATSCLLYTSDAADDM